MYDDTPRSDIGFATPRDDRFYTPRMHVNNTSSSDEWQTPRNGPFGAYNSDGDYGTPRDAKDEGYVVADPHSYWNEQYRKNTAASKSSSAGRGGVSQDQFQQDYHQSDSKQYQQQQQQQRQQQKQSHKNVPIVPDEEEEDDDGRNGGLTEKDVEDIFSYARHGRSDDVERLLNWGIPLNVRDEYGNTLLIIACQNGNKKVAKAVLRRGADINARNHKGNTPLHYCFHYGYGDTLGQYLMSKGANSSIRNNAGQACWDGI